MSESLLKQLRDLPASAYDGLTVSPAHRDRLVADYLANANATPETIPGTFCGMKIAANDRIPEGFAVITRRGEPVGIIDFAAGTATLVLS